MYLLVDIYFCTVIFAFAYQGEEIKQMEVKDLEVVSNYSNRIEPDQFPL